MTGNASIPEWMLAFASGALPLLGVLIGALWVQLNKRFDIIHKRLNSLGHEDRAIRDQMNSVMVALIENNKAESKSPSVLALLEQNQRLKWLLHQKGKIEEEQYEDAPKEVRAKR